MYVFTFWKRIGNNYQMPVQMEDLGKAIGEVIVTFGGEEEISA